MIYVDPLRPTKRTRSWPFRESCHMTADSIDELHAAADVIGLKRRWFQAAGRLPHYDLTAKTRLRAVIVGAREVSSRQILARCKALAANYPEGSRHV